MMEAVLALVACCPDGVSDLISPHHPTIHEHASMLLGDLKCDGLSSIVVNVAQLLQQGLLSRGGAGEIGACTARMVQSQSHQQLDKTTSANDRLSSTPPATRQAQRQSHPTKVHVTVIDSDLINPRVQAGYAQTITTHLQQLGYTVLDAQAFIVKPQENEVQGLWQCIAGFCSTVRSHQLPRAFGMDTQLAIHAPSAKCSTNTAPLSARWHQVNAWYAQLAKLERRQTSKPKSDSIPSTQLTIPAVYPTPFTTMADQPVLLLEWASMVEYSPDGNPAFHTNVPNVISRWQRAQGSKSGRVCIFGSNSAHWHPTCPDGSTGMDQARQLVQALATTTNSLIFYSFLTEPMGNVQPPVAALFFCMLHGANHLSPNTLMVCQTVALAASMGCRYLSMAKALDNPRTLKALHPQLGTPDATPHLRRWFGRIATPVCGCPWTVPIQSKAGSSVHSTLELDGETLASEVDPEPHDGPHSDPLVEAPSWWFDFPLYQDTGARTHDVTFDVVVHGFAAGVDTTTSNLRLQDLRNGETPIDEWQFAVADAFHTMPGTHHGAPKGTLVDAKATVARDASVGSVAGKLNGSKSHRTTLRRSSTMQSSAHTSTSPTKGTPHSLAHLVRQDTVPMATTASVSHTPSTLAKDESQQGLAPNDKTAAAVREHSPGASAHTTAGNSGGHVDHHSVRKRVLPLSILQAGLRVRAGGRTRAKGNSKAKNDGGDGDDDCEGDFVQLTVPLLREIASEIIQEAAESKKQRLLTPVLGGVNAPNQQSSPSAGVYNDETLEAAVEHNQSGVVSSHSTSANTFDTQRADTGLVLDRGVDLMQRYEGANPSLETLTPATNVTPQSIDAGEQLCKGALAEPINATPETKTAFAAAASARDHESERMHEPTPKHTKRSTLPPQALPPPTHLVASDTSDSDAESLDALANILGL
eukprot:m.344368 g.344368  ORF g.344368 m.344368 type:complete len:926 (-) comp16136_c0_seq2:2428-5205(-)